MPDGTPLRYVIQDFQPATFVERGAWVAFTSPMLGHARVRRTAAGQREVVIRNPGGGQGWYVGSWSGMIDSARLSVHDRLLYRRIEATDAAQPLKLRRLAREVALEGYAGRLVQDAARAALAAEARDLEAARAALVGRLGQALGLGTGQAALDQPLAAALGCTPQAAIARLGALADCLAPVGPPGSPPGISDALLARECDQLGRMLAALPDSDAVPAAGAVRAALAHTLRLAASARDEAGAAFAAPLVALRQWPAAAAAPQRLAWLLDGWPALAATWQAGSEIGPQHAARALAEIAACLPLLPREVAGEHPDSADTPAPAQAARTGSAGQEWLRGATERDIVARHEALLVRAL